VTDLSGNSAVPVTRTVTVEARQAEGGGGGGSAGPALLVLLVLSHILGRLRERKPMRREPQMRFIDTTSGPGSGRHSRLGRYALLFVSAAAMLFIELRAASASELSYTFMDFQALDSSVDAVGLQAPVPSQTVDVAAGDGDGIAVAGSVRAGDRFYIAAAYGSSIIDVEGVITNPLTTVTVSDRFDLITSRLGLGYIHAIGDSLDLIAEVSYDSANYDFGSLAGENFDIDDSGAGARFGFRWNPSPAFELFGFARHSPVGKSNLSALAFESDTSAHVGVRW
jgi:hypothetical protein